MDPLIGSSRDKNNIEESLLHLPLYIRIPIMFSYLSVIIQNSGASFKGTAFSALSAALDLAIHVYIDINKAQNILGALRAHTTIYFGDRTHQYIDLSI